MTDSSYDENKEGSGPVLKTDVLGRVKTGARQREAMLDAFERSGSGSGHFVELYRLRRKLTFAALVAAAHDPKNR
jgi:hypothetical protein